VSIDPEDGGSDSLGVLFGQPGDEFVSAYGGRAVAFAHAPVARLLPVLQNALVPDMTALVRLAGCYSQPIRAAVVGVDRILGYRSLTGDRARTVANARADWFLFDRVESHFNSVRRALLELCWLFGYPRLGATCTGFLHAPGAGVPRHCDELDAMVVQLFGHRCWCVEPNVNPPVGVWDPVSVPEADPTRWDPAFGRESQVVVLAPGSVLYVPGACWHQTRSAEASFSLTFALPGATADPVRRAALFAGSAASLG
jgi:hypothetical protein